MEIMEKYALSGQYTPDVLLREYRDSMILELKETSVLASSMFSHAQIHLGDGGIICLELLDTIVSEGRREEILHSTFRSVIMTILKLSLITHLLSLVRICMKMY